MKTAKISATERLNALDVEITNRLISDIEQGKTGVLKSYFTALRAWNGVTGRYYSGVSALSLATHAQALNPNTRLIFATFRQWTDNGAAIIKGSKGLKYNYFMRSEKDELYNHEKDYPKNSIIYTDKETGAERIKYSFSWITTGYLFDSCDVSGVNVQRPEKELSQKECSAVIVELIRRLGAKVVSRTLTSGQCACYIPSENIIVVPHLCQFANVDKVNLVILHELAHWSADNVETCKRKLYGSKGSKGYANEELIAELASLLFANRIGLPIDYDSTLHYLRHYITDMKKAPDLIRRAFSWSSKIADHFYETVKDLLINGAALTDKVIELPAPEIETPELPLAKEKAAAADTEIKAVKPKAVKAKKATKAVKAKATKSAALEKRIAELERALRGEKAKAVHYKSALTKITKASRRLQINKIAKNALNGVEDLFEF